MNYLSTYSRDALVPIAEELRALGISVIALPASDICMMARSDDGKTIRVYNIIIYATYFRQ